ncbi:MAG: hypothetical protein KJO31_13730 [Gammaproteobacteria bacterium]|nr:hypothetical protein [Gammaproteobacteria bacterium]
MSTRAVTALIISHLGLALLPGLAKGQGHYEANPQPTTKITRSSEYKSESREYSVPVEVTLEYKTDGCEAKLNIEYFQRGENAQVSSTLDNTQCAASHGSYSIQVRYRGADGKLQTRDYEESWSRDDAEPVVLTKQYFVGQDVDLVRVRSRRLTCVCGDEAADVGSEAQ